MQGMAATTRTECCLDLVPNSHLLAIDSLVMIRMEKIVIFVRTMVLQRTGYS